MFHFDENGAHAAAVGTRLLDVGVGFCLGPVPVSLGRVNYCIGKSGLRLGEGGSKLFEFGHDLCRGADCGVRCLSVRILGKYLMSYASRDAGNGAGMRLGQQDRA